MRIALVLAPQNAGWVIGKIAHRLCEVLQAEGHDARVIATPDPEADINHWMSFAFADGCPGTLNTMLVTHADDPFKVKLIRDLVSERIQMALCMSPHAMTELRALGVPPDRIWYVLPALDTPLPSRRICLGITTRVYDDGRKREAMLSRLAGEVPLDRFHFAIFGSGWETVIAKLTSAGATVQYDPGSTDWQGDYERIRRAIPTFDYYLYLGMDEGSLGTLDAVSAGVKTIVTAQGFHLSLPDGIDHPFTEYTELRAIFESLADARSNQLATWNWSAYAKEHVAVWRALTTAYPNAVPREQLTLATQRGAPPPADTSMARGTAAGDWGFRLRMLEPARVRGALARARWFRPFRNIIGR